MIVVDASATVHYLLETDPQGEWVTEAVVDEDVHVPFLLDVEVVQTLCNLARGRAISSARARQALDDLHDLDVARHAHLPFRQRVWELRTSLSAYDATYVALAEALDAPLVTTDLRIARAPGIRTAVLTP